MVLTKELKKMLKHIKRHPGVSLKDLKSSWPNAYDMVEFLLSHNLIEHIVDDYGFKIEKYKISLNGEIAFTSETKSFIRNIISQLIVPILVGVISTLITIWLT